MQTNNKAILLSLWQDKMSEDHLSAISKLLDTVGDEKLEALMLLKLKSPILTLVFSLFLGGFAVDRFYLGDIGLGILKLLFGFMTFGIWYVIDWFLTYKKAKEANFNKTMQMIKLVS